MSSNTYLAIRRIWWPSGAWTAYRIVSTATESWCGGGCGGWRWGV